MDHAACDNGDLKKEFHPKQSANCLSNIFFCWTFPLFYKGLKNKITENDLFEVLKQHDSINLGNTLENDWNLENGSQRNPSLWRVLWRIFGKEICIYGCLLFFVEFVIKLLQPVLIWKLMTCYAGHPTTVRPEDPYIYAFSLVLTSFSNVLCYHSYTFGLQQIGMKIRVAVSSLMYRKLLKLSKTAITNNANGQVINLLSNDVQRFDQVLIHIHYLWVAPLQGCVIAYLLYITLDLTATAGLLLFLIFVPVLMYLGRIWSYLRLETAIKTDQRVRLVREIISGIGVIKMYAWEKLFIKLVNESRRKEMHYIRSSSYLRSFCSSLNKFVTRSAVFVSVLVYVLTGNHVQAQYIFVVKSFYSVLKESMTTNFPLAVQACAETIVSVKRIQNFLSTEEILKPKPKTHKIIRKSNDSFLRKNNFSQGIFLHNVSTRWSLGTEILSNISINVASGQLAAVVGPTGSGKSTLLKVILDELPLTVGRRDVFGRISYASQESWLFSGTIKENILFGQSFSSIKYNEVVKACALSQDFELLPNGDDSLVGEKGNTLSGGQRSRINLARALYKEADIYLLDDPLSAVDNAVGKQLFEECILKLLRNKSVILVTHQVQYLRKADIIFLLENGKIQTSGTYEKIKASVENFGKLLSEVGENDTNNDEFRENNLPHNDSDKAVQDKEFQNIGAVSFKTYFEYLNSGGGWIYLSLVFLVFIVTQALASGTDFFEAYWVNIEVGSRVSYGLTSQNCIYIYIGLILSVIVFTMIRSICYFIYFIKASTTLHDKMFHAVINTTMDFINTNPSGRILNRFCKDIGIIDEILPVALMDTIQIGINVLAISLVIAIVNPWMLLVDIGIFVIFCGLRIIYLLSSRDIKRFESTFRSPIFSHLNSSIEGLETIRAFRMETILKNQFDNYQNQHTSAFYAFLSCSTTFGFWLDMFCSVYLGAITANCFWGTHNHGGDVGLIITQAMGLTGMFQWGMKQWSELENQMVSVERVINYTKLEPEKSGTGENIPQSWPQLGQIGFKSVSLKYKTDKCYALDGLEFRIEPKEKIGIVGRTGAGKSSLISTLFRLVEFEGTILIDGVDIAYIPLQILRSEISIIPQEPVLFSGTLRQNLDPFNQYEDEKLWTILDKTHLKDFVISLPLGLENQLLEGGLNLSVGQKQLFCLARALLRESKILVLDEATANVDLETDLLIQTTIEERFADSTVIIIAHRLNTIAHCDKVLVIEAGKVVEFGHPHKLFQNEDGVFRQLVSKTGQTMTSRLRDTFSKNYLEKE